MKRMIVRCFWSPLGLILCMFLFAGCKGSQPASQDGTVETTESPGSVSKVSPHQSGWADPAAHGPALQEKGKHICLSCHALAADSGETQKAQACRSCHDLFPHGDDWGEPLVHGAYVDANGTGKCATLCHGADMAGGLSKISCTKCHDIYPHSADWANAEVHGVAASGGGKLLCKTSCHGETLAGGNSGVSCGKCHEHYPHAGDWTAAGASGHGVVITAEGSTQCEKCHGTNNAGSIFSAFCNDCHSQHLSAPATCKGCHEAGTGLTHTRPDDGIHPETQDCANCHDYATDSFEILRGETITFDESPHADPAGAFSAESDNASCMRCHTAAGFADYISDGIQGHAALAADYPDPLTCASCHNTVTSSYSNGIALDTSGFVPGDDPLIYRLAADGGTGKHIELTVGREGICLQCHAPRSSDGAIKANTWVYGLGEDDTSAVTYTFAQYPGNTAVAGTVSSSQRRTPSGSSGASVTFHYVPVMATFYGNDAKIGFQYPSKTYVGKNNLMPGYDTCFTCHNPHTTQAQPAKCAQCHAGVSTEADLQNIRVTTSDYDGDGNVNEGIYYEIEGVKAKLYQAIQNYAVIKRGIVFDPTQREPWRRSDTNAPYDKLTPRLIKALYNYHLLYRDPGAYVHNSKYMVELLYDSIENLNAAPGGMVPVDMTGMVRP